MKKKLSVALICGGKSHEHDVSLLSAKNILDVLNLEKFDIQVIYITKKGFWRYVDHQDLLDYYGHPAELEKKTKTELITVNLADPLRFGFNKKYDVLFSVIHGKFGEDGTIQAIAKTLNVPIVGSDSLSSAICMDKEFTKKILRDSGLPVVPFLTIHKYDVQKYPFSAVVDTLGPVFFVKPCNGGSSLGVSKVIHQDFFQTAMRNAFHFDDKILIEKWIDGVDIECAIFGNNEPFVSVPGKILYEDDFYSYDIKYAKNTTASLEIPANIDQELTEKIQAMSLQAFTVLGCKSMARVDFFLTKKKELFLNEVNTIPGFTANSAYTKLLEYSDFSYREIVEKLIYMALDK